MNGHNKFIDLVFITEHHTYKKQVTPEELKEIKDDIIDLIHFINFSSYNDLHEIFSPLFTKYIKKVLEQAYPSCYKNYYTLHAEYGYTKNREVKIKIEEYGNELDITEYDYLGLVY